MGKLCKLVDTSKKGMHITWGTPSRAHYYMNELKENSDFNIPNKEYYYEKYDRSISRYRNYIKIIYKDTRIFIREDFFLFIGEHNLWHKLKPNTVELEVLYKLSLED